jgi:rhodanese-related sulfurtransferase
MVVEFLQQQGFSNVINLAGGIDTWATEIEPTMERY